MNANTSGLPLTPEQISRRRAMGKLGIWGAFFLLSGGIGAKVWYNTNVREYTQKTAELQQLLTRKRDSRLKPYDIDGNFALDSNHNLYVPKTIDGVVIKLNESSDLSGKLIRQEAITQGKVLEAKIGVQYRFASTTFTYEGDKLLITERELIQQIMRGAVTKAKSLGATTIAPTINFNTELMPDVPKGLPSYWNSKTTISGTVAYYR